MKLRVCWMADLLDRINFLVSALHSSVIMSLCLCMLYLQQKNNRWFVLSVMFGQFGQLRVGDLPIQYRWLFSGVWSVRSCVRTLMCFRLRLIVALMNCADGNEGSMDLILSYCFDLFHQALVSAFVLPAICCLINDMLIGSCFQRKWGKRSVLLDPYWAASLAISSAALFPIDPICPTTHVNVIFISGRSMAFRHILFSFSLSCSLLMLLLILLIRYWAGCGLFECSVLIVAWLLMLRLICSHIPMFMQARCWPRMIATNSPSKTVCSVSGPSLHRSSVILLLLVNSTTDVPTYPL